MVQPINIVSPPHQETPGIREVNSEQYHIHYLSEVCFVLTPPQILLYIIWVQVLHYCHQIHVIITILKYHAYGS